jgi:Domain of unknown function (DUF1929)/Divergent InlB B-repeat domain
MKKFAFRSLLGLAAGVVALFACQDFPESTQPSELATATYPLTITGAGTGSGKVSSSPSGISCTITAGTAATTGCSFTFTAGTVVTLSAKPVTGHSFVGWSSPCSGTGTCKIKMSGARTISAQFLKGPFTIRITSGSTSGSGRVQSASGPTPQINCLITNGVPAATGCSGTYAAYTILTLTSTPSTGYVLTGWSDTTCGTGACAVTVIKSTSLPVTFARAVSSNAATEGRWSPVITTPVVAVHLHLMPSGKVLFWGDTGEAQLWDPANTAGGFMTVVKPFRLYCTGHTVLPDGRLLVVGGTSPGTRGLRYATVFDPSTRTWSPTGSMAQGRYYPTTTVLPNGNVLAISGHDTTLTVVTIPEVWNGSSWRRLTTAPLSIPAPYYPAMFVAPNGKVFLAGFPRTSRYLDVSGTGSWTTVANRNAANRVLGTAVMYAPGKVLYAGGGDPPTASAEVIDLNQAAPSWRSVAGMAFARRQTNATLLADGTVLVTGGTSGAGFNNQAGAVHVAELWNPATESWKRMASESRNRTYHSTAMLLPSGRVLSSGSGEGGGIPYSNSELSAQIFTPPYLYKADGTLAPRPSITSAPARLSYGQSFSVATPDAAHIIRANLIRLSSVTHAFNESQVIYPLRLTIGSTSVSATAPPNGNLAPPGVYMLFLINDAGVPSVAKMVSIGS